MTTKEDRRIEYHNGDVYVGETNDEGKLHGNGIYVHERKPRDVHECKYDGEWENGQKNGHGTQYYSNGDRYVGKWKDGKRKDKKGRYYYANGDYYEGEFLDNHKHDDGFYIYKDGETYDVTFEKGDLVASTRRPK